jgi:hypothetical protein
MKKSLAFAILAAALSLSLLVSAAACKSSGGFEPVVLDFSKKTPTPASEPGVSPTPAPAPASVPPPPAPTAAPPAAAVKAPPASAPAAALTPPPAERIDASAVAAPLPERVLASRLDAFNRRDLDAVASLYSSDARVYDPPSRVRDSGAQAIRDRLSRELSAAPFSPLVVSERFASGPWVVERESGGAAAPGRSAVVVYEVRGGKIANVWIFAADEGR